MKLYNTSLRKFTVIYYSVDGNYQKIEYFSHLRNRNKVIKEIMIKYNIPDIDCIESIAIESYCFPDNK